MSLYVPNALIRRLCYPTSYRLPKMPPRLEFPQKPVVTSMVPVTTRNTYTSARTSYAMRGTPSRLVQLQDQAKEDMDFQRGNLQNDEYRFFVGFPYKASTVSICRWCGGRFETEAARKAHKRNDCKQALIRLYAFLRRDQVCLVCDTRTVREYWGVPLCGAECESEFRFAVPDSMKFEINRAQISAGERSTS